MPNLLPWCKKPCRTSYQVALEGFHLNNNNEMQSGMHKGKGLSVDSRWFDLHFEANRELVNQTCKTQMTLRTELPKTDAVGHLAMEFQYFSQQDITFEVATRATQPGYAVSEIPFCKITSTWSQGSAEGKACPRCTVAPKRRNAHVGSKESGAHDCMLKMKKKSI